jgi:hypothetical protein
LRDAESAIFAIAAELCPDGSDPGEDGGMPAVAVALVDGHVHLHDCFEVPRFLDTAAANVAAGAMVLGMPAEVAGCLMLSESRGVDNFARLADGTASTGAWRVSPTREPVSLVAHRNGSPPIVVIAGRQIVCREGLEVLALGTRAVFADGQALRHTLGLVAAEDALAVVPWGVGKWQGARGRLVAELLQESPVRPVYLGDNGGRLGLAPRPRLFARAASRGIWVLPGSDPLPFAGQLAKVAGYGFVAEVALGCETPFATLKGYLDLLGTSPRSFGRLETLPGFVRSQVAMQLQKRYRPRAQ